jgi:prepilin-type processing-associated H-X9-DG protein
MADVPRPADTIAFADSAASQSWCVDPGQADRGGTIAGRTTIPLWVFGDPDPVTGGWVRTTTENVTKPYFTVHSKMVNLVFADGHAKALKARNTYCSGATCNIDTQKWGYDVNNGVLSGWPNATIISRMDGWNADQK